MAAQRLPGVGFMKESRRYYPNRDLASALIGFVDAKNHGVGGLELVHNTLVTGTGGTLIVQHDAQQHVIATMLREAPTPGVTLELTIDARLQFIAERELRAAVEEHGAIGGTVVMMDPHTGEILALVSEPALQPERLQQGRSRVARQPRRRDDLRAGIDLQDDHRRGGPRGRRHQAHRHRGRHDAVPLRHREGDHRRAPGRASCRSRRCSPSRATAAPRAWPSTASAPSA